MSNPRNLPTLLPTTTLKELVESHLGPIRSIADPTIDWQGESWTITLQNHWFLPHYANWAFEADDDERAEQLASWIADWSDQLNDESVEDLGNLVEFLRSNFDCLAEQGVYRCSSHELRAMADLADCLGYLGEGTS